MKVVVTGATGFVGRHVVARLLECGHAVVAVARDVERARGMPWFEDVEFFRCDLHEDFRALIDGHPSADALIHLAWPGLSNFRDLSHITRHLPADLAFLNAAVHGMTSRLIVAGTCLEYGMQYGPLVEDLETKPTTPYGFAKDTLRKTLQLMQKEQSFALQWMRLFYMYGQGQNPKSLLAQLDTAIEAGDAVFNMSQGDQLRDYSPIEQVARNFVLALENPRCDGVINCCSGTPTSVIDLVRRHCEANASAIELNRGHFPYPDYEPLAFWGVPSKLASLHGPSA